MSAVFPTKFDWTPELIETALRMLAEGKSAGYIAREFGTTRNTIMGKMSRERIKRGLHVPKNRGPLSQPRKSPTVTVRTPGLPSVRRSDDTEDFGPIVVPMIKKGTGTPCSIVEVCGCKWPVGHDPKIPGRHIFCNEPRPINMPYCETHRRLAGERFKPWSAEDDHRIKQEWKSGRGKDLLAQILRRPKASVVNRARHLGLMV